MVAVAGMHEYFTSSAPPYNVGWWRREVPGHLTTAYTAWGSDLCQEDVKPLGYLLSVES